MARKVYGCTCHCMAPVVRSRAYILYLEMSHNIKGNKKSRTLFKLMMTGPLKENTYAFTTN